MILNIYKPVNMTSFKVVAEVKRRLGIKKAGHAGTLDPLADGVLVVLTGKDTKKQDEIMKTVKEYEAEITFGIDTPSHDMEFVPKLAKPIMTTDLDKGLKNKLEKYRGTFEQRVPEFSAKKVLGKPLYKLARKKALKELDALDQPGDSNKKNLKQFDHEHSYFKKVEINDIQVMSIGENSLDFSGVIASLPCIKLKIRCSHGTYIRALARDLGMDFDSCAVLTKLTRTAVGDFTVDRSVKLESLSS